MMIKDDADEGYSSTRARCDLTSGTVIVMCHSPDNRSPLLTDLLREHGTKKIHSHVPHPWL